MGASASSVEDMAQIEDLLERGARTLESPEAIADSVDFMKEDIDVVSTHLWKLVKHALFYLSTKGR